MERIDNQIKRELYLFWGRHPNSVFSRSAISIALDCNVIDLDEALNSMVNAGIVVTDSQDGETLYYLTKNDELRRKIIGFSRHSYT